MLVFTAGGWTWACAVRGGFQHQTQLMQDGWLGLLREKEDIGKRKGRAMGRDAGPTNHSQWHSPGQQTPLQPPGAPEDGLSPRCNPPSARPPAPAHTREVKGKQNCTTHRFSGLVDSRFSSSSFFPHVFYLTWWWKSYFETLKGNVLQFSAWLTNSICWCFPFYLIKV